METVIMLWIFSVVSGALANCETSPSLSITTPKKIEALSGTCLKIPCNYSAAEDKGFNTTRDIFGVWIKNDSKFQRNPKNVVFNSSGKVTTYPMEITGDLSQRDCTTLFSNLNRSHTDTYFFRIENEPFKATASCDRLRITVKDSPRSPRISISGELKENESVNISCSALTPCPHSPPQLTWNLQKDAHNQIKEKTDGTFRTKIQQSITLSYKEDGFNISCSATYPVDEGKHGKTAETHETLDVTYAPKETSASISPPGLVSAGSYVNLTCSSRANPPVSSFTWFLKTKDGPKEVAEGHFYRFNVSGGGVYYCVATNTLGYQESAEIPLRIAETEQPSSLSAVVGGIIGVIVLMCVVFILWWLKSRHSTSHPDQNMVLQEQTTTAENEDIHYGEIDFSRQRPEPSSDSVQDSAQQPDVVYSQVQVSKSSTQTADGPECIYAQVKKK